MSIPSWLLEVQARAAAERAFLQHQLRIERDTLNKAPGYHEVGTYYSTEPDPGFERDKLVVDALKRRWPDLVPIWVRWVFLTPTGEPEIFRRHGLARILDDPHHEMVPLPLEAGSSCSRRPHIIEKIFHTPDPAAKYKDIPGPYEPFSWNVFNFVAETYKARTPEELKKVFITDEKERLAETKRKNAEEMAYRDRDIHKFVQKKLDNSSEVEIKNMMLRRYFGGPEPEKKVSVNIRREDAQ